MSILQSIIFNVRERILSSDLNNLQADAAVNSQAATRAQSRSGIETTTLPSALTRQNLAQASGLVPSPGVANSIDLSPGILATYSPAYPAPTPGQAFTGWRQFNSLDAGTVTNVVVPTPVGLPTWYLVEARCGQSIQNLVRDIKNTLTNIFNPTNVPKILTTTMETQTVAGVAGGGWPTPSGAEWVPLALVRRTNLGGVVAVADLYDVRPLPSDLLTYPSQAAQNRQGQVDWQIIGGGTDEIELTTVEPPVAQGVALEAGYFAAGLGSNLDLSTVLDVNDGAFVAQTLYHLYIAPFEGLAPRNADLPYQRGRLILSTVLPSRLPFGFVVNAANERVWANDATMLDPGPGGLVAVGEAIYLGSVMRNTGNNSFAKAFQVGRHVRTDGELGDYGTKTYTQAGSVVQAFALPPCAQVVDVAMAFQSVAPGPVSAQVDWNTYGGIGGHVSSSIVGPTIGGEIEFRYDAPYDGADIVVTSATVLDTAGAAPLTWFLVLSPVGWEW